MVWVRVVLLLASQTVKNTNVHGIILLHHFSVCLSAYNERTTLSRAQLKLTGAFWRAIEVLVVTRT
jgi:hypothetical protein